MSETCNHDFRMWDHDNYVRRCCTICGYNDTIPAFHPPKAPGMAERNGWGFWTGMAVGASIAELFLLGFQR